MTLGPVDPRPWTRRRWWFLVALILAGQIGVIFWLSDRSPARVRPPAPAPHLQLAGNASAEILALNDPTLLALPHRQGFSGPAWLDALPPRLEPVDRPEEPHWLPLTTGGLGATLRGLDDTNHLDSIPQVVIADAPLTLPPPVPLALPADRSSCRLDGELAQRPLLTTINLSSWTNSDLLTNSIVRLAVDASGRPVSVALLAGSGYRAADDQSLAQARAARFEDLRGTGPVRAPGPLAGLSWGQMVFEWHTLPVPATNSASATNPPAAKAP